MPAFMMVGERIPCNLLLLTTVVENEKEKGKLFASCFLNCAMTTTATPPIPNGHTQDSNTAYNAYYRQPR